MRSPMVTTCGLVLWTACGGTPHGASSDGSPGVHDAAGLVDSSDGARPDASALDASPDAPSDPFAGIDVWDPGSCAGGMTTDQLEQLRSLVSGPAMPGATTTGFAGQPVGRYILRTRVDGADDDTALHAAIYGRLVPQGTIHVETDWRTTDPAHRNDLTIVFDLTTPPFGGDNPSDTYFYEPFSCVGFGHSVAATPGGDPADVGQEAIACSTVEPYGLAMLGGDALRSDYTTVGLGLYNKNLLRYRAEATSDTGCVRVEFDGWTSDHAHSARAVLYALIDQMPAP